MDKNQEISTNKSEAADKKYHVNDDSILKACAAMDCTGLIPALPQSESELESYQNLYPYLPDGDT